MTRPNLMTSLILVTWWWIQSSGIVFAEQPAPARSTHPKDYAAVYEVDRRGKHTRIKSPREDKKDKEDKKKDDQTAKIIDDLAVVEIDDRSLISIKFDEEKMQEPDDNHICQVIIGIEAFQTKNGDRDQIPVTKYTFRQGSAEGDITFKNHDRPYERNQGRSGRVPNTIIDPERLIEKNVDQIEIRIINRKTRERVVYYLRPRKLGFRTKIRDTLMFIKRRGAKKLNEDRAKLNEDNLFGEPLDTVSFDIAPGVTFGTTWFPRERNHKLANNLIFKPIRMLHPGIGINASILKWNDPALKGTRLNVGLGVQISLFNNIIMGTYGVNLQAQEARTYFGIGISFLELNGAISGDD